ncbi:hypothetical protein Rsub_12468 [Raphidocelis subcapitata]|uniref:Uncharacterized protein n=1 Tax=Raphidocelis subcapitata TaxID=307507 RepID=A0A2V0PI05_9CHLO|nr:hypothetical protein Rsub_12468 [Raphidocelis subcapitata]|eukprot:GBF99209.1 hypothetical protein Rsub_12468 [Raphidocelis subcapitata]
MGRESPDEDAPPPLDSLEEQVRAVLISCGRRGSGGSSAAGGGSGAGAAAASAAAQPEPQQASARPPAPAAAKAGVLATGTEEEEAELPVASLRPVGALRPRAKPAGALARGFFDAPAKKPAGGARRSASSGGGGGGDPPLLRAKHPPQPGARAIPDFLMLPPGERAARDALVGALAPTRGMLDSIQADPVLRTGFEDPEVMAAVAQIAADPTAISKYKGNARVLEFYAAMGALVGGRLEELEGAAAGTAGDGGAAACGGAGGGGGPAGQRQRAAAAPRPEVRWRDG